MRSLFRESFSKDLSKITDSRILREIERVIIQVESVSSLSGISNIKKLKGSKTAYRIRIGDYRIGLFSDSAIPHFSGQK